MALADEFLKRLDESDEDPVDQKWEVSFERFDNGGTEKDRMTVCAPNRDSAEEMVKRMAKVKKITFVKRVNDEDFTDASTLYGFDWG